MSTNWAGLITAATYRVSEKLPNAPSWKVFDLCVGDVVRHAEAGEVRKYTVTGIYPYIFTVTDNKTGAPTSFQKIEYLMNEVQRVSI